MEWTEVVKQLEELNVTNKKILEIQGLEFALEPKRYVARILRSGEGTKEVAFWYQLIAGGDTFVLIHTVVEGCVRLVMSEGMRVSQSGVLEFTRFRDDEIMPEVYIPRAIDFDFDWSTSLPFGAVTRMSTRHIWTNHDAAPQWVAGGAVSVNLRKEVWEKDVKLMDMAAESYLMPQITLPK